MKMSEPKYKHFSAGEEIFHKGDVSDDIYIIKSGIAEVIKHDSEGKEIIIAVSHPNDVFGELGILLQQPRAATVRAKTELEVIVINPRSFGKLYEIELGQQLKPVIQAMAERLRMAETHLTELQSKNPVDSIEEMDLSAGLRVRMVANTKTAMASLGNLRSVEFIKFPVKVGRYSQRRSDDLFHLNDFHLYDRVRFNISRSHFSLVCKFKKCYFVDRSSRLGSIVNGTKIGGDSNSIKRIALQPGKNSLFLGLQKAGFSFTLFVDGNKK